MTKDSLKAIIDNIVQYMLEIISLLTIIKCTQKIYRKYGSRSSKKTNYLHNELGKLIKKVFYEDCFKIDMEKNIKAYNHSGHKKCDIVLYKDTKPVMIFPVKFVQKNFGQNRNNYWENLIGECKTIKICNPDIKIIPRNIFLENTPYFNKAGNISKMEKLTIDNRLKMYNPKTLLPNTDFDNLITIIVSNDSQKCECENQDNFGSIRYFSGFNKILYDYKKLINN